MKRTLLIAAAALVLLATPGRANSTVTPGTRLYVSDSLIAVLTAQDSEVSALESLDKCVVVRGGRLLILGVSDEFGVLAKYNDADAKFLVGTCPDDSLIWITDETAAKLPNFDLLRQQRQDRMDRMASEVNRIQGGQ